MAEESFHAAIVGSGPSGFYAAEAILQSIPVATVDMFERLPTPFGLVRSGVAPDHPKLKEVTAIFDRIMRSDRFRLIGNVQVGTDIQVNDLRDAYHTVVLAYGASRDRKMGIPGEDLRNCHSATEFVGWYNGHPDFRDLTFDLSQEIAVVVGHGNVAADVCRILLQPADALRKTDIATHALDVLGESRVREVHIVGRRGPVQAKFTQKELRGLGAIPECTAESDSFTLGDACTQELGDRLNVNAKKNVEFFDNLGSPVAACGRKLLFHFFLAPASIEGEGRVERFVFRRTKLEGRPFEQRAIVTGELATIDCGLVFTSIGYRGDAVGDLPFDLKTGTIPSDRGRIDQGGERSGLYVTGWLKRGPTGIIGTNRADSIETIQRVVEDLPSLSALPRRGFDTIKAKLTGLDIVDRNAWDEIDKVERARGETLGKPREKFTRVADMLTCCGIHADDGSPVARSAGTKHSFASGTPTISAAVGS